MQASRQIQQKLQQLLLIRHSTGMLFQSAFIFRLHFVEYVTSIRMEKAERLLVETEDTIQDIGRAVGYEQSLTFIRVFKKHSGVTPGQYRKTRT